MVLYFVCINYNVLGILPFFKLVSILFTATPLQQTPSSFETPITAKDDSLKRPSDDSTVDTSEK